MALPACTLYRPRQPRSTPLYRLVEAVYGEVRDEWEERFEGRYGCWRASTGKAVGSYLDCGILDNGFAQVGCGACGADQLVAFSCKGRGVCPSGAAKRAGARTAAAMLRRRGSLIAGPPRRSSPWRGPEEAGPAGLPGLPPPRAAGAILPFMAPRHPAVTLVTPATNLPEASRTSTRGAVPSDHERKFLSLHHDCLFQRGTWNPTREEPSGTPPLCGAGSVEP